ncbi:MAG: iron chelate uptake ABC transporter family permease subunit [Methanothrix sp.]|nr:iron chelate uptake ABC transporter family permease subunit [Methanothrix sp.]MDD4446248.1 iron chelate uptake ABC transporter family permease subunit [Methanothrix sp.]
MIDLGFFQYDFMNNALAAGLAASVLCGVIGIYVILNKIVFISDGIAHAAFGGIGLGYFLGYDPLAFGVGSAVLTALGIGMVSSRARISEDTAIGVFMATGMALGIMLLTLSQGYARDLYGYLFGNILAVTRSDVLLISALTLTILVLVFLLYKEFLLLSFDPIYAEAIGLPVQSLRLLLLVMVAFSVVILIKIVGIIMVIALLTIPGAISRRHMMGMPAIMAGSIFLGGVFVTIGLLVSYELDVPSGATIILTAAVAFFLSTLLSR